MMYLLNVFSKPCRYVLLFIFMLTKPVGLLAQEESGETETDNKSLSPFMIFSERAPVISKVTVVYIELHTGPGRGYPVTNIAERGETIEVLKQRTDWVLVRTHDDKEGWARADQIANTLNEQGEILAKDFNQLQPPLNEQSTRKGDWELGIMLGDYGGTDVISAFSGYHFTNNIALELSLSENFGSFSSGQYAVISLLHQPFPELRISPFISLGGGVRKTNPRSNLVLTEDRTDDIIVTGAGFRMKLYNRFVLRVQYNNNTVLTSRDDDTEVEEWKIGLSALF